MGRCGAHCVEFGADNTMQDWPEQTFSQALDSTVRQWAHAEAVVIDGRRLTFAALRAQVSLVAANLRWLGLKRGDHVAVCMGNSVEWVLAFLAAAEIGAVTVPVNTRFKPAELEYCLNQSDAAALIVADRFLGIDFIAMLREICPDLDGSLPLPGLPRLRLVVVKGEEVPSGALPWSELLREPGPGDRVGIVEPSPRDVVLIQYTSGTTSFPKGAMLTHDGMLRDAWHVARRLGLGAGSRYYSARPLYHVAGTTLSLVASLVSGACYITTPHFDVSEGLRLLEEEGCTHTSGNDTMFLMMMAHPDFPRRRLKAWGGMAAASTTVLEQLVERMGLTGVCSGYGLSEASPNVACGPWDDAREKRLDGFATILPGIEVRIRDMEAGTDCPPGVSGEILVRGWNVMRGYYKMPEQTARAIDAEGWLHTGDLGVLDGEGRLRFEGRLKDLIRVGGENVAPAEIEDVLHKHPAIEQAQVVGVPHPRLVEVAAAYVILRSGAAIAPEAILDWCRKRMANFRAPRYVRIVDGFEAIGMTGSSKVQKSKLREFALDDLGLRPAAGPTTGRPPGGKGG